MHITIGCHAGVDAQTRHSPFGFPLMCQLVTRCMLRSSYIDTRQLYSMVSSRAIANLQNSTSKLVYMTQHYNKVPCPGYCEQEEWIDLATVKGYRRIVMCQELRDELILNLTGDAANASEDAEDEDKMQDWQRVVIAMCEGRLLPTPWLNKVMLHSSSALSPAYCISGAASHSTTSQSIVLTQQPEPGSMAMVSGIDKCIQATLTGFLWECVLG